ncbi:MAG: hypothetical protein KDJ27_15905 [Gammaproteobacteria bacterium]|nr:hypothetical protein [Gammaproteobacteria bacterium]MCB1925202.1 hypothetical protein [Gammaproteobacteria bacterium]
MSGKQNQLIDTNPLDEYQFVGHNGDRITLHASPLLATLARFAGADAAKFFALPVFNERRTHVSWYSQRSGALEAFWEMPDDRQEAVLGSLEAAAADINAATAKLGRTDASESGSYQHLLPLLLNFPEPVEYHLYVVDGLPVATHWGMNKQLRSDARDTLTPFITQWRERIALRRRQAEEAARNDAKEQSFLARLLGAGARSGAVDVSLIWNDKNDLDLHVDCPNGRTLNFTNKVECGGILDIDRNAHANALTDQPVENIVWTSAPTCKGRYTVYVHFFRQHAGQPDSSPFTLRIKQGAKTQYVESSVGSGERRQVAAFDI